MQVALSFSEVICYDHFVLVSYSLMFTALCTRPVLCCYTSQGIPQYWTGEWVNVWRGEYAAQHFDVPRDDPRSRSVFFE